MRSDKFITWRHNRFTELKEDAAVADTALQEKLWNTSLVLCNDEETVQVAERLSVTTDSLQPGYVCGLRFWRSNIAAYLRH